MSGIQNLDWNQAGLWKFSYLIKNSKLFRFHFPEIFLLHQNTSVIYPRLFVFAFLVVKSNPKFGQSFQVIAPSTRSSTTTPLEALPPRKVPTAFSLLKILIFIYQIRLICVSICTFLIDFELPNKRDCQEVVSFRVHIAKWETIGGTVGQGSIIPRFMWYFVPNCMVLSFFFFTFYFLFFSDSKFSDLSLLFLGGLHIVCESFSFLN